MKLSTYFKDVIHERLVSIGIESDVYEDALSRGIGVLEKMLWLRFDKKDEMKRKAQIEKALKRYNDVIVEIAKQLDEKFDGDHDAMIRAFRVIYTNLYKDSKDYCHNENGKKKVSVNIANVREFLEMKEEGDK